MELRTTDYVQLAYAMMYWEVLGSHLKQERKPSSITEVTNMRPAGRMRPAKEFPVAREHFGETSTFKHFFPV